MTNIGDKTITELMDESVRLGEQNRNEKEIAVYDEVIRRFGDNGDPDIMELVASAWVSKGILLGQLGRIEEELALYDEVIDRFGPGEHLSPTLSANITPEIMETVNLALENKAEAVKKLGQNKETT